MLRRGFQSQAPDNEEIRKEGAVIEFPEGIATMLAGCLRNFIEIAHLASQEELVMACKLIEQDIQENGTLKDRVLMTQGLVFLDYQVMQMRDEAIEEDLVKAV